MSTKNEGIRYIVRVNKEDADIVKKSLLSYLSGLSIVEVNDYFPFLFSDNKNGVIEFKLKNHFAFPLKKQEELKEHDPIAYITGAMTKLATDELVSFQIVASALDKSSVKDIKRISHLIYKNGDLVTNLKKAGTKGLIVRLLKFILFIFLYILLLPVGLLVFLVTEGKEGPFLPFPFEKIGKKTSNPYQEELEKMVKGKLQEQLFTVSMRLLVTGNDEEKEIK